LLKFSVIQHIAQAFPIVFRSISAAFQPARQRRNIIFRCAGRADAPAASAECPFHILPLPIKTLPLTGQTLNRSTGCTGFELAQEKPVQKKSSKIIVSHRLHRLHRLL